MERHDVVVVGSVIHGIDCARSVTTMGPSSCQPQEIVACGFAKDADTENDVAFG